MSTPINGKRVDISNAYAQIFNSPSFLGEGEVHAFAEGVSVPLTSAGRNGEEHHRILSGSGKGQPHHQLHRLRGACGLQTEMPGTFKSPFVMGKYKLDPIVNLKHCNLILKQRY